MKIFARLLTFYLPSAPWAFVYMLQQVEYEPLPFLKWVGRAPDYRRVMYRKKLVVTAKAAILLLVAYAGWGASLAAAIIAAANNAAAAALLVLLAPFASILVLASVCWAGYLLLSASRRGMIESASARMQRSKAVKIAVLGSYGKTTIKELLATVLGEGKELAATPGNNNITVSHARWVLDRLTGKEEVLVVEFGEFRPGDIARMATMFKPDAAVITGIAPNHLENYGSYEKLKQDINSITRFVEAPNLHVSSRTAAALGLGGEDCMIYDEQNVLGWKVSGVKTGLEGTDFKMTKGSQTLRLHSELLGGHMVEPLALVAALADRMGVGHDRIESGVLKTTAFEHRMQPLNVNGAVVIDDTYNGNIEGMRAGLKLLSEMPAKRKIYVTPGLVEQGAQTESVHTELGILIAEAGPDKVVLMDNSVREIIERSMKNAGFKGELVVESDPLRFYSNMQYEIAAGDLVLMQNDWTDNYQ